MVLVRIVTEEIWGHIEDHYSSVLSNFQESLMGFQVQAIHVQESMVQVSRS